MSGAIAMAGLAAMRTGAGLVSLGVPNRCLDTISGFSPCLMSLPLADDEQGKISLRALNALGPWLTKATCIAVGPGMGRSRELQLLVRKIVRSAECPVVLDADGLNNLADSAWRPSNVRAPLVITPHPGEWSRLCGVPASDRTGQILSAFNFAKEFGITVVLKGQHTLVTDGESAVLNTTGTPAMAIGGSGDVLTGMITALICQGLAPRDAAHLGVYVHGLAGELAQARLQSHVILPTDLIDSIGAAFWQCRAM